MQKINIIFLKLTLSFLLLLSLNYLFGTSYFVANSGNNNWPGTRPDSAFQTLSALQAIVFNPGDTIFLNRGDVFREQLTLNLHGTSSAYIVITSFGNAVTPPVVSGTEILSNWSIWNGGVYKTSESLQPKQFIADDKMMTSARYPNSGWLSVDSAGGSMAFKDGDLTEGVNFWKGCDVRMRTNDIAYEYATIDSFLNGVVRMSTPLVFQTQYGFGYYIDHAFSQLDSATEWYYDAALHEIYFQPPQGILPSSQITEATVFDEGISLIGGSAYAKIDGINFYGQYDSGIKLFSLCNHIIIKNCNFQKQYLQAVLVNSNCSGLIIDSCTMHRIAGDGIRCPGNFNGTISNCSFTNLGLTMAQGLSENYNGTAIYLINSSFSLLEHNYVDSVGFAGIFSNGSNNIIDKNFINHCMQTLNYGGGIYTFSSASHHNTYSDNFVLNSEGNTGAELNATLMANGIFIYYNCDTITLLHNLTANCSSFGILIGETNTRHLIDNNTSYNSKQAQLGIRETYTGNSIHGLTIKNNTLFSLSRTQDPLLLLTLTPPFTPLKMDSNSFCNPYNYFSIRESMTANGVVKNEMYEVSRWQQVSGNDLHSFQLPLHLNHYQVTDTTGTDLILNGEFTNNYNHWTANPDSNNLFLLDNATSMDGGCIKVTVNNSIPIDTCNISSSNFVLQAGQAYQFSFSDSSLTKDFLWTVTKQNFNPYSFLSFIQPYPVDTFRKNFTTTFINQYNCNATRLDISLTKRDSTVWLDNIHLFPVNVVADDSSEISKLFYNWSPTAITVNLNGIIYRDISGNIISGSLNLNPFDFKILIQDQAFISSTENVFQNQFLNLFPNPASSGSKVFFSWPETIQDNCMVSVFNVTGTKIFTTSISKFSSEFILPDQLVDGMYLIQISTGKINWFSKLIIVNQ